MAYASNIIFLPGIRLANLGIRGLCVCQDGLGLLWECWPSNVVLYL